MSLAQVKKFEHLNDVLINVYTIERQKELSILPIRLADRKREKHVNLLYAQDDDNVGHFAYIKNLSHLVSSQLSCHNGRKCLHCFGSSEKLESHGTDCQAMNECAIRLPSENDKWVRNRRSVDNIFDHVQGQSIGTSIELYNRSSARNIESSLQENSRYTVGSGALFSNRFMKFACETQCFSNGSRIIIRAGSRIGPLNGRYLRYFADADETRERVSRNRISMNGDDKTSRSDETEEDRRARDVVDRIDDNDDFDYESEESVVCVPRGSVESKFAINRCIPVDSDAMSASRDDNDDEASDRGDYSARLLVIHRDRETGTIRRRADFNISPNERDYTTRDSVGGRSNVRS